MPGKVAEGEDLTHFRMLLKALSARIADRQSQLDGANQVWAEYGPGYLWITVQGGSVTAIDGQYTP